LITIDGYYRGGALLDHKEKAEIAFDEAKKQGQTLKKSPDMGTVSRQIFQPHTAG